jgi:hypothetical protein
MSRRRTARLAGFTFLLYIAVGITSMIVLPGGGAATDTTARLARIAQHASSVPLEILFAILMAVCAVTLGVTLHALTRDVDRELATLGMAFRVMEGMIAASAPLFSLGLLHLATRGSDAAASNEIAALLFRADQWKVTIAAMLFAFGSLLFTWLLLRGRIIARPLAWLGVVASIILVVCLPLQLMGLLGGPLVMAMWIPMAAFEIPLGAWWLVRGTSAPITV